MVKTLHVLLASNANLDEFPTNSLTHFSNLVPYIDHADKLYVRIRRIAVSKRLKVGEPHPAFVKVHLGELETNALQIRSERVLCRFNFDQDTQNRGDYQIVDIEHAPFLLTSNVPLSQLSIKLTDNVNKILQLDYGLPTLVSLELNSMDTEQQFMLTCMSHGVDERRTFTSNKLNKFHVRIPQEMNMSGWEVAVANVGVPPQSKPVEKISFRVRVVQAKKVMPTHKGDLYHSYQDRYELLDEFIPLIQDDEMNEEMARDKLLSNDFFISKSYQETTGRRQQRDVRFKRSTENAEGGDGEEDESMQAEDEQEEEVMDEEIAEDEQEEVMDEDAAEDEMEEDNLIDQEQSADDNLVTADEDEHEDEGEDEGVDPAVERSLLPKFVNVGYERTFTYMLNEYTSTQQLCSTINDDLRNDININRRLSFSNLFVPEKFAFFNLPHNGYRVTFQLDFDAGFSKFLGEKKRAATHLLFPYAWLPFYNSTSLWRLKKPNVGLLYCDIVEPSIVSNQKLQLLHLIPFNLSQDHYLYEPKHMIYHPVVSRTFTDIGFQITQPDGELYEITDTYGQNEAERYGGVSISLLFRPIKQK